MMLAFNSDRTGNYEIFTMRDDRSQLRQLTTDAGFDTWWARMSPDRQRILFYRTPQGVHDSDHTQASLWIMNADGSGQRQLRPPGADGWEQQGHAEWSPDGTQFIMFGGSRLNPQIFLTDAEGQLLRQVTDRPGQNLDPSWSPDGQTIVFVGCPQAACIEPNYEVFTIPVAGGEAQQLTSNAIRDHDPYFSPSGTHIAWLAQTNPGAFGVLGGWDVMLMQADGSEQHNLTNDGQLNSKPHWSRDGQRIYFHRLVPGVDTHWRICALNFDGTGLTEITDGADGNDEYPDA